VPSGVRILLVEHDDNDLHQIVQQLEGGGYDAVHRPVSGGAEFEAALRAGPWDAVVCADALPGFSLQLAMEVVQDVDPDMPFIVVSHNPVPETAPTPLGAVDACICKAQLEDLVPSIRRALQVAAVRRQCRQAGLAGVRVLLVDDNRDLLAIMREVLELEGCSVAAMASAEEALAHLQDNEPPNVIVCDLSLPGMDGYEFLRLARQLPGMDAVPALAMTGWGDAAVRSRGEGGFMAQLTKPVPLNELRETLLRAYSASLCQQAEKLATG